MNADDVQASVRYWLDEGDTDVLDHLDVGQDGTPSHRRIHRRRHDASDGRWYFYAEDDAGAVVACGAWRDRHAG